MRANCSLLYVNLPQITTGEKCNYITARQHASHPSSREPQQNSWALGSHASSSSICHPQHSTGQDDLGVGWKETTTEIFLPSASFRHTGNKVNPVQVSCSFTLWPHNMPLLLVFPLGWGLSIPLTFGGTWARIAWSKLVICFHLTPALFCNAFAWFGCMNLCWLGEILLQPPQNKHTNKWTQRMGETHIPVLHWPTPAKFQKDFK